VNSSLPTILVSCKCDNPENTRQINVDSMEAACLSCVEAVKFASNVPESARLCLSSMLRAIMAYRTGQFPPHANSDESSDKVSQPSRGIRHSPASDIFNKFREVP
jgi:hypothetical protein